MITDKLATETIEAVAVSQDVAEALRAVADADDRLLASGPTKRAIAVSLKDKTQLAEGRRLGLQSLDQRGEAGAEPELEPELAE
ncbi:hypothetical protein ABWI00_21560 [Algihabitans albus]|uniref:hypothetical protein n=1 Tax=Algihabitans albus TaxID=2164067 RepID=UPI0035D12777